MKSMTELAGGELCLPQRPHNQVGAVRRRSAFSYVVREGVCALRLPVLDLKYSIANSIH